MTHVPGPWKIIATDDIAWSYVTAQDHITVDEQKDLGILAGGIIAEVFYRIGDNVIADVESNANLIHAAPDLLEACESARRELRSTQRNWDEQCLFDADLILTEAIRKARGEA